MANKIICEIPEKCFCGGMDGDFKKNTQIVAPKNHFGIVIQNDKPLKCFDESIVLNAKTIPELKVPFFGKIKNVKLRFFPYGVSGNFIAANHRFTLKRGALASADFKIAYSMSIEDPMSALKLEKSIAPDGLKADGSLITPAELNDFVVKEIEADISERQYNNKPWQHDPNIRGIKYSYAQLIRNESGELDVLIKLEKLLKEFGYALKVDHSHSTIGYIDLIVNLNR